MKRSRGAYRRRNRGYRSSPLVAAARRSTLTIIILIIDISGGDRRRRTIRGCRRCNWSPTVDPRHSVNTSVAFSLSSSGTVLWVCRGYHRGGGWVFTGNKTRHQVGERNGCVWMRAEELGCAAAGHYSGDRSLERD
ncbi:hypothetical protein HanXRQr2_Chr02g0068211 [Helianthus annuus]|uniref:Uncharacterized protein n=1 Tax=Helianthus annuus TaxID=4232 RepID=A0A9K3JP80_HELAN|nr:hypothetical protein HanXRQr2_Chr02g0068211 [Helianthus annuus]